MFGMSLPGWENLMVGSLAIAAFAAAIVGIATWAVVKLQRQELASSQQELSLYKLETATRIAEANAAGETAKEEAAKANKSAEGERLARVKLEQNLAPRRLVPGQQLAITVLLSQSPSIRGKTVRLESYGLDAEAAVLAFQIKDGLRGFVNVDDSGLMTRASGGSIALGVHVTGRDSELVKTLLNVLGAANLMVSPDEPFPQGSISFGTAIPAAPPDATVFVGVKPITQ